MTLISVKKQKNIFLKKKMSQNLLFLEIFKLIILLLSHKY